jgi:hypothetical protein
MSVGRLGARGIHMRDARTFGAWQFARTGLLVPALVLASLCLCASAAAKGTP